MASDLDWQSVLGLQLLYDELYSHSTDAASLSSMAAAAKCTHVLVAAGRAVDKHLKVAAAGAAVAVFAPTEGGVTRISHGVHWYCWEGKSFGFAPDGDVRLDAADVSHTDDPLRLSWHNGQAGGGWRAGNVCGINGTDEWRKLVWGFSL